MLAGAGDREPLPTLPPPNPEDWTSSAACAADSPSMLNRTAERPSSIFEIPCMSSDSSTCFGIVSPGLANAESEPSSSSRACGPRVSEPGHY